MSYREYVIAAYAVFGVVMLWDLVSPHLQLRQALREARLHASRHARPKSQDANSLPAQG
jgi:heme exporter protein D